MPLVLLQAPQAVLARGLIDEPFDLAGLGGSDRSRDFGTAESKRLADQLWQSAAVRRVHFFSAAYFSAAALTIGLMICSSASY